MPKPGDTPTPATEAGKITERPRDEYDDMSPEALDKAMRDAQELARKIREQEDAEAAARNLNLQRSLAAALPTPEQIRAQVAQSEKIEKERARRRAERAPELRRIKEESWVHHTEQHYARFADATLDTLDAVIREPIDDWIDAREPGALILLGGVGTGKTHVTFAVMRELYLHNLSTKFWPVPKLLDALRPNSSATENVAEKAVGVDVLALDDLGAERPTDWSLERLYILVNDRWMGKKRTIVTSNLKGPALRDAIGDRMFSRLVDGGQFVDMGMTDRRKA